MRVLYFARALGGGCVEGTLNVPIQGHPAVQFRTFDGAGKDPGYREVLPMWSLDDVDERFSFAWNVAQARQAIDVARRGGYLVDIGVDKECGETVVTSARDKFDSDDQAAAMAGAARRAVLPTGWIGLREESPTDPSWPFVEFADPR